MAGQKARAVVWQWVPTFKARGSAPPPPPPGGQGYGNFPNPYPPQTPRPEEAARQGAVGARRQRGVRARGGRGDTNSLNVGGALPL